ncbi:hypothetical protein EON66_08335, partial [archaeon]
MHQLHAASFYARARAFPPCRNLLRRMLCKRMSERITLPEIMEHDWVTCEGTEPFRRNEYVRIDLDDEFESSSEDESDLRRHVAVLVPTPSSGAAPPGPMQRTSSGTLPLSVTTGSASSSSAEPVAGTSPS